MMKQRRTKAKVEAVGGDELDNLGLRLQNLRRLQNTTQSSLAKQLRIGQTALSHMERRDDILLSSLNAYVEALGGQLHVAVTFPDAEAVSLVGDLHWHPRDEPSAAEEPTDDNQLFLPNVLGPAQFPPSTRDVIFSIRPVHAQKILDGSKTVELRRRFTGGVRPGTLALIYSTSSYKRLDWFCSYTGCPAACRTRHLEKTPFRGLLAQKGIRELLFGPRQWLCNCLGGCEALTSTGWFA